MGKTTGKTKQTRTEAIDSIRSTTTFTFSKGLIDGLEEKLEEELWEDEESVKDLVMGAEFLDEAKALEEKARVLKEQAAELLAPVQFAYSLSGVSTPRGQVSMYYGTSSRMDKKRLQRELVTAGVKAALVVRAIEAATTKTTNEKLTIQYKVKEQESGQG